MINIAVAGVSNQWGWCVCSDCNRHGGSQHNACVNIGQQSGWTEKEVAARGFAHGVSKLHYDQYCSGWGVQPVVLVCMFRLQ